MEEQMKVKEKLKKLDEVREEVNRELGMQISSDSIRGDQYAGLFNGTRDHNDYRVYTEAEVERIKYVKLMKDLGLSRRRIRRILGGEQLLLWEKINRLLNITIPRLKMMVEVEKVVNGADKGYERQLH